MRPYHVSHGSQREIQNATSVSYVWCFQQLLPFSVFGVSLISSCRFESNVCVCLTHGLLVTADNFLLRARPIKGTGDALLSKLQVVPVLVTLQYLTCRKAGKYYFAKAYQSIFWNTMNTLSNRLVNVMWTSCSFLFNGGFIQYLHNSHVVSELLWEKYIRKINLDLECNIRWYETLKLVISALNVLYETLYFHMQKPSASLQPVTYRIDCNVFVFFTQPRNIFLHGHDCHVRIGDFGLACRDIIMEGHKSTTSPSSGNTLPLSLLYCHDTAPHRITSRWCCSL